MHIGHVVFGECRNDRNVRPQASHSTSSNGAVSGQRGSFPSALTAAPFRGIPESVIFMQIPNPGP